MRPQPPGLSGCQTLQVFRSSMAHSSAKMDPLAGASPDARAATKPGAQLPYAPISQFLERADRSGRQTSRVTPRRLWRRLRSDPHVLLAIAIAVPAIVVESIVGMAPTRLAVLAATLLIAGQIALGTLRRAPSWLPSLRLAAALAFMLFVNGEVRNDATGPLRALLVPIVAMAAAAGGRGGLAVALAGDVATLVPMFPDPLPDTLRQRTVALAACTTLQAVEIRR